MRLSIPLTAVSLIALIGAAATYSNAQPSQQIPGASLGLTVDALRVIDAFPVRANGARHLQGEFAIRRARAGERYLVNAGTGGACLVAQIPARAGTCATDSECNIRTSARSVLRGYCLPNQQPGDLRRNQCWVRPPTESCLRQQPVGSYRTPPINPGEMKAVARAVAPGDRRPVRWMVLGCLNGSGSTACGGGSGDKIYDQSPMRDVN